MKGGRREKERRQERRRKGRKEKRAKEEGRKGKETGREKVKKEGRVGDILRFSTTNFFSSFIIPLVKKNSLAYTEMECKLFLRTLRNAKTCLLPTCYTFY